MKMMTTYKVKIKDSHGAFKDTIKLYRQAVDFLICVTLKEWKQIKGIEKPLEKQRVIECFIHYTRDNTNPKYDFDQRFEKFPSYLRSAAISEAIGKVFSYKSDYNNCVDNPCGKEPSKPQAGYIYLAMYRDNCFIRTGTYNVRLKVFIRNTWDWLDVKLKKSDVDYILKNCATRKECVPTLNKRGKNWYLDFIFEYLDLQGKKKRLHYWNSRAIQQIVTCKASRNGVRISRVCAWNTLRLAFDGSGKLERDKDNYGMCTFTSGKRYNCDLSASYNIAARYFIREIIKSLPVKARLGIEAKVPQCTKRTTCILSTLISINADLVA